MGRIRLHANPLAVSYATFRGERPAFVEGRPVEVEVGCADAQFLFERAALDPGRLYVGLEIRQDLAEQVNAKARATGAPVHVVFCQAQLHMTEIFAPRSVDRVYVNFPDPWFKRKHHARRMMDAVLARQIADVTRPGGEVMIQTDIWEVALEALDSFERLDTEFVNRAGEWTFGKGSHPFGARSWREQNAEETGLPFWRLIFTKR
jgi:tRNA (guanine-N7-)-methyltransferase